MGRSKGMVWAQRQAALARPDECLLTIVTVNRNNAWQLPRTLESLAQVRDDPQIECIFIDGASSDDSVAIARSFYDSERLVSEPDRGIYHAMNKGLYRARGRYILWLNSGDELLPDFKNNTLGILSEGGATVLSFGLEKFREDTGERRYLLPRPEQLPAIMLPHGGIFFDRKAVLSLGGYNEAFCVCGDKDLILRLFFSGVPFVFFDTVIGRFYADGISTNFRAGMNIENLYIAGKFGLPGGFKHFYWWLAKDHSRVVQVWQYAAFRLKLALRQ